MIPLVLESQSQPKRQKLYKGKPSVKEADVLSSVLEYLHYCHKVVWAHRLNSGAYKTQAGQWVKFGWVGAPDIIGQLTDGRLLAIECKSSKGQVRAEQATFLNAVSSGNGVAIVARSVEDVIKTFRECGIL